MRANATAVVSTEQPPLASADRSDHKSVTERNLIERISNGETELFYDLIRPYQRSVFLAGISILGNEADAEEIAQEALLKAFRSLATFRHESKFSTWLIQIAVNEAKMKLRKDHRHLYASIEEGVQTQDGDYSPIDLADWREIPSDELERGELRQALKHALQSLEEKYRTVFVLRDMEQLSIAETAKVLGISEQNVKTRLLRARLQLRDLLAPLFRAEQSAKGQCEKAPRPNSDQA